MANGRNESAFESLNDIVEFIQDDEDYYRDVNRTHFASIIQDVTNIKLKELQQQIPSEYIRGVKVKFDILPITNEDEKRQSQALVEKFTSALPKLNPNADVGKETKLLAVTDRLQGVFKQVEKQTSLVDKCKTLQKTLTVLLEEIASQIKTLKYSNFTTKNIALADTIAEWDNLLKKNGQSGILDRFITNESSILASVAKFYRTTGLSAANEKLVKDMQNLFLKSLPGEFAGIINKEFENLDTDVPSLILLAGVQESIETILKAIEVKLKQADKAKPATKPVVQSTVAKVTKTLAAEAKPVNANCNMDIFDDVSDTTKQPQKVPEKTKATNSKGNANNMQLFDEDTLSKRLSNKMTFDDTIKDRNKNYLN